MNTSRALRISRIIVLGILLGLLTPLAASARVDSDSDPGSPVRLSNLALATKLFDAVLNDGDVDAAAALVSEEARIHTPYGVFTGPSGLNDYLDLIRRAYPGASFTVTSIDVDGDAIVVRWTMTATRYQAGPTEPVVDVLVRTKGETAVTVADGQVAGLTQLPQETTTSAIVTVVSTEGPTE